MWQNNLFFLLFMRIMVETKQLKIMIQLENIKEV